MFRKRNKTKKQINESEIIGNWLNHVDHKDEIYYRFDFDNKSLYVSTNDPKPLITNGYIDELSNIVKERLDKEWSIMVSEINNNVHKLVFIKPGQTTLHLRDFFGSKSYI